ncbi:MAG: winged helix-turn-helix domain-containing protein [bacterium]|nr:winged helix-turn-helix domain-containing protein [bacterium]
MEVKWLIDKKYQIYYYLRVARRIQYGFYQNIRAMILPYNHPQAWYFPDYSLFENKEFSRRLEALGDGTNLEVSDQLLISLIEEKFDLYPTEKEIQKVKANFEKIEPKLETALTQIFRNFHQVKSLSIIPTKFGTGSSYFRETDSEGKHHIGVTCRLDKGYDVIINSIVSILIQIEQTYDDKQLNNWIARKSISDFIMFHTKLKDLLSEDTKLSGVMQFIEEYKGDLAEESAAYLRKLGYPLPGSFSYTENSIHFNKEPLKGLENKEIDILKKLIDKRGEIISFEEVGDVYWGKDSPDKFSLYSIAKIIEKIRKSFRENNIPERCLQTVRKRGYLLYD